MSNIDIEADPDINSSQEEEKKPDLNALVALKDYAISRNIPVTDEIIDSISALVWQEGMPKNEWLSLRDKTIRNLTALTYPTTIRSMSFKQKTEKFGGNPLLRRLPWYAGLSLLTAIFCLVLLRDYSTDFQSMAESILAISLGVLGAIVFLLFNFMGIITESAFNEEDITVNSIRIFSGAIVGWIIYFAFLPTNFANEQTEWTLAPFLAGFSTRLVVGLILQASTAIEITLGLKDTSGDLKRRNDRIS